MNNDSTRVRFILARLSCMYLDVEKGIEVDKKRSFEWLAQQRPTDQDAVGSITPDIQQQEMQQ